MCAASRGALGGPSPATTLAAGTVLHLRLETPVSTKTSHLKDAVTARVVREVPAQSGGREVAIPLGTLARGLIEKLIPSSSPADRARLRLRFTQLEIPGQPPRPLAGRLKEVENARENVLPDGTIQGVLASEVPLTMVDSALEKLKKSRPEVGEKAGQAGAKALGKADTSIEFPAGADLHLTLQEPLLLDQGFPPAVGDQLATGVSAPIDRLLARRPAEPCCSRQGRGNPPRIPGSRMGGGREADR
jgi:hypothetical protein